MTMLPGGRQSVKWATVPLEVEVLVLCPLAFSIPHAPSFLKHWPNSKRVPWFLGATDKLRRRIDFSLSKKNTGIQCKYLINCSCANIKELCAGHVVTQLLTKTAASQQSLLQWRLTTTGHIVTHYVDWKVMLTWTPIIIVTYTIISAEPGPFLDIFSAFF